MIQSTPRCAARPQDAHVIFPSVRNFITESVLICRKFWRASCLTRHFLGMSVFIIWLKFFLSHLRIRPTGDLPLKVKHYFFFYTNIMACWLQCALSLSRSLSVRLQLHLSLPLPTLHPAGLQLRWQLVNRPGRFLCRLHRDGHKRGEKQRHNHTWNIQDAAFMGLCYYFFLFNSVGG